jgi:hypothetical protein
MRLQGAVTALVFGSIVLSCGNSAQPPDAASIAQRTNRLSGGAHFSCFHGGTTTCWGLLSMPKDLKSPPTVEQQAPRSPFGDVRAIGGGPGFLCVTRRDGEVACGTGDDRPLTVVNLPGNGHKLTVGDQRACAVGSDGPIHCFAAGSAPKSVPGTEGSLGVAVGIGFACALAPQGTVSCWGDNQAGFLGDGTTTSREEPRAVISLPNVVQVVAGRLFACALSRTGTVHCWGLGDDGQLGDGADRGTDGFSSTPVTVKGLSGIEAITAGHAHACALTQGEVRCWGANGVGQLGDGTTERRVEPVAVKGLDGVVEVVGGGGHSCALRKDDSVWCWGNGGFGQVGGGATAAVPTPRRVELPR